MRFPRASGATHFETAIREIGVSALESSSCLFRSVLIRILVAIEERLKHSVNAAPISKP
jgi:hypothetical protein